MILRPEDLLEVDFIVVLGLVLNSQSDQEKIQGLRMQDFGLLRRN
jgi:hypothetical protein